MQIPMHEIDDEFLAGMNERCKLSLDNLPHLMTAVVGRPQSLSILASAARTTAAYCYLVDPLSANVSHALYISKQALNALFSCAMNAPKPTEVSFGIGELITYTDKPNKGSVHVGNWLDGFFLNLIFKDWDGLRKMCSVPTKLLRESTTRGSEYYYLYKDALCAYINKEPGVVNLIIDALKATDTNRSDITNRFITVAIDVPQLEVFLYAISADQRFNVAMQQAIQNHKEYWSDSTENSRNFRGFIAIELLGLVVLGMNEGLDVGIDSPYLPLSLIRQT